MDAQGTAVMVMMVTVKPEDEAEFNRWYDEEHIPELMALPGFLSARRFSDCARPHSYLTIYELDDEHVVTSEQFVQWRNSAISSKLMLEKMVSVSRGIYRRTGRHPA